MQESLRIISEYLSTRGMISDFENYVNDQGFELKDMNLDRSVLESSGEYQRREDIIWA